MPLRCVLSIGDRRGPGRRRRTHFYREVTATRPTASRTNPLLSRGDRYAATASPANPLLSRGDRYVI